MHPALAFLGAYSRIAPTERGGYRLVRLARRTIPRQSWNNIFTTPHGLHLRLDLGTYPDCCMSVGLYELDTLRLLRKLLHPGAWFVDAGANIGYFTLLAARCVGESGRVDAFEPDNENRQRLLEHLALNGNPACVRVHATALAADEGTLRLYHPLRAGANHGMSSAFVFDATRDRCQLVPARRLDRCLGEGSPDIIKMDLEGGELGAIKGMTDLLRSTTPPTILYEHSPRTCRAAGHRPSELADALRSIQPRYRIYWIGSRLRPISDPAELDRTSREGNLLAKV
jgi:FkbM family methyltransferase